MDITNFFKNKGLIFSLYLLFIIPLFPTNIKSIIIAFFSLILILDILKKRRVDFRPGFFFANASLYLFIIISLAYTDNLSYGFKKIETMSSLFIFPLVFSLFPEDAIKKANKNRNRYLFVYIVTITVLNTLFFVYHLGHYKETIFKHYMTVIRIAQGDYSIHPIYMSMHISVSLLFSVFLLYKEKSQKRILLILFLDMVLLFFLFLLLKKGPVLGLLLGILTFVLLKNKKQIWYLFFSIIFVCFLLVLTSSKIRQKFIELIKIETVNEKDVETTSSNIRYSLYKYGLETFKESFLFGHGIGDYRDKLIESYKDNPVLFNEKYNTHNQYLSFLISLGIIGFLIFLVSIGINLKQAYKKGNHILMVILIFYCFVMITENILEREDGVLYFSFFICFFNTIHVIESEEKPSIVNT